MIVGDETSQNGRPLTAAQLSIWLAAEMFDQSFRFNAGFYFRLPSSALPNVVLATLTQLADEATLQRVSIVSSGKSVQQKLAFSAADVTDVARFPSQDDMLAWISEEIRRPMRISGGAPLFRQWMIAVGDSLFVFIKYHHIVLDGFGQKLLCDRFDDIYKGKIDLVAPNKPNWSSDDEYFEAVESRATSIAKNSKVADYASFLRDVEEGSTLGWTRSLFASEILQSRRILPVATRARVRKSAINLRVSETTLLVALVAGYLRRVTGERQVVFGLTLTGRTRKALLQKPSMQSNELPIKIDFHDLRGLDDLVLAAKEAVERAVSFQEIRNDDVHRQLGRVGHDRKLTRILVNILPFGAGMAIGNDKTPVHQIATGPVGDLTINVFTSGADVSILWDANPDNYTRTATEDHATRFESYAISCLESGGIDALNADFYSPADLTAMRRMVGPTANRARQERLFQTIDRHATDRPDAVAVECERHRWTYLDLKAQSDALAYRLRETGAEEGGAIGVYGLRSTLMIGAVLGIQKAGCSYVPLDPSLPRGRLLEQIERAGVQSIVRWDQGPEFGVPNVLLEGSSSQGTIATNDLPVASGETTAYIIFTSGSTGRPKGVMVSHRAIENRILWMQEQYGLRNDDAVLQKTPFTFDVSVWEFFWPLVVGAKLVMAGPDIHKDPRLLHEAIRQHHITTVHFVPQMLDAFLDDGAAAEPNMLRNVYCSGEALKPTTVRRFFSAFPDIKLHNLYGPTEAAVDVSHWTCSPSDGSTAAIPIGWPVANTELRVLNAAREPSIVGVPGELYIGGVQVASGYVNEPDLTAERFVDLPGGGRFYRTGDLVVLTADRGVSFLGRLDHQVKIRGLRVELGEIEAQVMQSDAVRQCAVVVVNVAGSPAQLVAYVVLDRRSALEDVRRRLVDTLPDYMVPTRWVILDTLPSLSSGKIDRKSLPAPSNVPASNRAETDAERRVVAVWAEVLKVEEIGVDVPFFELGGDSMMTIRVRALLEEAGWNFDLVELLRNPTARQFASKITLHQVRENHVRARFEGLSPEDKGRLPPGLDDAFPMSAMQEAMVYQAEVDENSSVYRVVTSLAIKRPLRWEGLSEAVQMTVARHPMLRSRFDLATFSRPMILVEKAVPTPLTELDDISHLSEAEQRQIILTWMDQAKYTVFDLSKAPGLQFYARRTGPSSFQLSVVEHHAVLDGWSDLLMLDQIVRSYDAALRGSLPAERPLRSHFADFVAAEASSVACPDSKDYWRALNASMDASPLPRTSHKGATRHRFHEVAITSELQSALVRRATQCRRSLKSLLFAAHLKVLSVVSGNSTVSTGTIFNGRLDRPDGDAVVGVFLNTLPFSTSIDGKSFLDLAEEISHFDELSYPHGRYPFSLMQNDIDHEIQLDSYVNFMDFHRSWGDGEIVSDARGIADTNFPLAVNFLIDPVTQALSLWLDCDEGSLDADVCARMEGYYVTALQQVADDPKRLASSEPIIGSRELDAIAVFNETTLDYDADVSVHRTIERQAHLRPDGVAVVHFGREVTYRELVRLSRDLASSLTTARVKKGEVVGICVPRGPELIAGLLAIHTVGAAFLPLDPSYPVDRLNDIVADSGIRVVLSWPTSPTLGVEVSIDASVDQRGNPEVPLAPFAAEGRLPAYVIYTSGSTGRPKGAIVSHQNLLNCFAGMDQTVGCRPDDCMLALTSVSFDISILELLWPLTKGAKVVIGAERQIEHLSRDPLAAKRPLDVSLFFFGAASQDETRADAYRLVLDAARFADRYRFKAVWTPERHFHEFGGLYPNPAVLSAALATITEHVELRGGSVVAPLHDSIRLTEDWALVDNLSKGRVGIALASGWNSDDFALAPNRYQSRKDNTMGTLDDVRTLWGGGRVTRQNGVGKPVGLLIHPRPVRRDLPIWLTSAGSLATFAAAGTAGLNLLTHLLGQNPEQLGAKIAAYRAAWKTAGHAGSGCVTLMIHTFLLPEEKQARELSRKPFKNYLRLSADLLRQLAASMGTQFSETLEGDDMEAILDLAVDRYFDESGLFGSPDSVMPMVRKLQAAGVDELACLIDFGVSNEDTLRGLSSIERLMASLRRASDEARHSCEELIERHGVTMMQSTPSFMTAAMGDPALIPSLKRLRTILVGGEPLPSGLAAQMRRDLSGRIFNMYGPTETTIWSTTHELTDRSVDDRRIPIGRPLANTRLQVLDSAGHPTPIGVPGELWIGGDGVCQGYWNRPELTEARFRRLSDGGVYYRTGDRVGWRNDGELLFFGRVDRQIKLRGHRIELDEVESVLSRHAAIGNVAVVVEQAATGASEIVAFLEKGAGSPARQDLSSVFVNDWGAVWDQAYRSRAADAVSLSADFSGWLSSYTGEPIPVQEMQEWLTSTLAQVDALRPKAIVDVGVGLGILMRELVPRCSVYTGLDLSKEALRTCAAAVPAEASAQCRVSLMEGDAMALARLPTGVYDLVIINSVLQYFPSEDYLVDVLREAIRLKGSDGAVFLGDLRSLDDLTAFHTSVQFFKASAATSLTEMRRLVERQIRAEREMCLSPAYFATLRNRIPNLGHVELRLKRGFADNELNSFRYDAVIYGHEEPDPTVALDWTEGEITPNALETLVARVRTTGASRLRVKGLPNHRLDRARAIETLFAEGDGRLTKWDIEKALWELGPSEALSPEAVTGGLAATGYEARLLVSPQHGLRRFDLDISRGTSAPHPRIHASRGRSPHRAKKVDA